MTARALACDQLAFDGCFERRGAYLTTAFRISGDVEISGDYTRAAIVVEFDCSEDVRRWWYEFDGFFRFVYSREFVGGDGFGDRAFRGCAHCASAELEHEVLNRYVWCSS